MSKKQNNEPELIEEEINEEKVEEPKKVQNEGKKLFSSVNNKKGTRLS